MAAAVSNEEIEVDDVPDGLIDIRFSTVRAERLKMFSDAVWSIIATLMIAPSMHFVAEDMQKSGHGVETIARLLIPQIGFFFLAFLIVCSVWASHVWTFQTMESVTDLSIVLNLAVLLAGGFLPYFYSMMTRFMTWRTVLIYASIHVAISLLMTCLILHAFAYNDGEVLRSRIKKMSPDRKNDKRRRILTRVWVAPFFALVAVPLALLSNIAATVSLSFILVFPWMQSFLVWLWKSLPGRRMATRRERRRWMLEREVILTERIRKGRIEAFNDGAFAIVSTLILLDINEKYLPTKAKMEKDFHGDAIACVTSYWGVYLSYALVFILIGLLWDVQLTFFKNFNKISRLMLLINQWSVACVGVIPLAFTFILHFTRENAVRAGIKIGCVAIFGGGFWNCVMYLVTLGFANCRPDELWMHPSIRPGGSDFKFFVVELSASPICSVVVFALSFLKNELISAYVGAALIGAYALFMIFGRTLNALLCYPKEYESLSGSSALNEEAVEENKTN